MQETCSMTTPSEYFMEFMNGAVKYFDDREHGRPATFRKSSLHLIAADCERPQSFGRKACDEHVGWSEPCHEQDLIN